MISNVFVSFLAAAALQTVDDFVDQCEAFQAEFGGESDCQCLGEKIAADDELQSFAASISGLEDVVNAPDDFLDAIADCSG